MGKVVSFNPTMGGKYFNGERLKIARMWRNLSATQLADFTGFSRQTISMLENGKLMTPEFATVQKLSEKLEFPITFFLEETKINFNESTTYVRS